MKYPYFGGTRISLQHSVGQVEGSSHAKKQPDLFSHFNRTLTRDRQTHSHSKYPCQHSIVRVKNQHLTQTTSRSRAKCGVVLVHMIIQAVSKFRAIFLSI